MEVFDPKAIQIRLEDILKLIKERESQAALAQIDSLVSEFKSLEGPTSDAEDHAAKRNRAPEAWRLIAAHLKAAEVQIQETHLAFAEESLTKAIGVVIEA